MLCSIHARANFIAPFTGLKGHAADELGRTKMWMCCSGMMVVGTDSTWPAYGYSGQQQSLGNCSPEASKGVFPTEMSSDFSSGQQDLLD